MFKHNTIIAGTIYGAILPAISLFIFLFLLKGNFLLFNKPGTPYLIAVGINLLIIRWYAKQKLDKTVIGIAAISFIFMLAIFIFKLQPIR